MAERFDSVPMVDSLLARESWKAILERGEKHRAKEPTSGQIARAKDPTLPSFFDSLA